MEEESLVLAKIFARKVEIAEQSTNTLVGASINEYHLYYEGKKSFYNGKIIFDDGKEKDVCFVPFDQREVSKIFHQSIKGNHNRVLRPWFYTYVKEIEEHVISYDRFDFFLPEWWDNWKKMNSIRKDNDLPPPFLQNEIVEIAGAIEHMHDRNVFHQALNDQSSYVICSGNIKIIKFLEGGDSVNKFVWNDKKLGDLRSFGDLLTSILTLNDSWAEMESFLSCFSLSVGYRRLLSIITAHPFLKRTAKERVQYFSSMYQEYISYPKGSPNRQMLELALHDQMLVSRHISGPFGWLPAQMSEVLTKVYNYRQRKSYKLNKLKHLLRFLRNLSEHYHEHAGDLERIDREIRRLWPQFIHRLHEQKVKVL